METPLACFLPTTTRLMYKACIPPTHFFRTKFRVDEVLRGSVEPFRVLGQSGPFGSSSGQFRTTFRVMNPSVGLFEEATTWHCQYDINSGVWGRSCDWSLLQGVPKTLQKPFSIRDWVFRASFPPAVFVQQMNRGSVYHVSARLSTLPLSGWE